MRAPQGVRRASRVTTRPTSNAARRASRAASPLGGPGCRNAALRLAHVGRATLVRRALPCSTQAPPRWPQEVLTGPRSLSVKPAPQRARTHPNRRCRAEAAAGRSVPGPNGPGPSVACSPRAGVRLRVAAAMGGLEPLNVPRPQVQNCCSARRDVGPARGRSGASRAEQVRQPAGALASGRAVLSRALPAACGRVRNRRRHTGGSGWAISARWSPAA